MDNPEEKPLAYSDIIRVKRDDIILSSWNSPVRSLSRRKLSKFYLAIDRPSARHSPNESSVGAKAHYLSTQWKLK